jgi:uncharacterized protein (DUF4415 family)
MTVSKENMAPVLIDPDEIPDMYTPYWQKIIDATPVTRGRPAIPNKKISTTIRLDAEILQQFRSQGPRWQTRINEALKKWLARG